MFICIKKKMQKNKIEKNSEKSENKFAIESENQVNDAQTVNSKESGSSLKSYAFIRHHSNKNL